MLGMHIVGTLLAGGSLSDFYLFHTCDSLQPVTDVDYSPGMTHTFTDPSEDILNADYRLYGTGCFKLGGGRYWDITGNTTLLANTIKNMLFNIYIPASTDTSFSIINILGAEDVSICNILYNALTSVVAIDRPSEDCYTDTSVITEGQYNVFQFIESGGNYTLKINDAAVSFTGTVTVPTSDIVKLRIGASTTDVWYFDNTMSAK